MNPTNVIRRVQMVAAMADDDEGAHSMEDTLHVDVLRAIADGECTDPKACAIEALKTLDIKFARWCA